MANPLSSRLALAVVAGAMLLVPVLLSSLKLLSVLVPMTLAAPLASFVHGYGEFVAFAAHYLFGWIDWRWMRVSDLEGHVMVVGAMLLAVIARVADDGRAPRAGRLRGRGAMALLFVLFYIFVVIVPLVVLPGWFGTVTVGVNLAVLGVATLRMEQS